MSAPQHGVRPISHETREGWAVTVQVRREWPARAYQFRDQSHALMFAHSCKRDRDYRVSDVFPFGWEDAIPAEKSV